MTKKLTILYKNPTLKHKRSPAADKILAYYSRRTPSAAKPSSPVKKFLSICYHDISDDRLKNGDISLFVKIGAVLYNYFHKSPPTVRGRIFFIKLSEYEELLCVHLMDNPFLLNSIHAFMDEINIEYETFLHPIFSVKRKKSGRLVEFDHPFENTTRESIIAIKFEHPLPAKLKRHIEREISRILSDLHIVVNDFDRMRNEMKETRELLIGMMNSLPEKAHALKETIDFFQWMLDGNFIFMGCEKFYRKGKYFIKDNKSPLGLLKRKKHSIPRRYSERIFSGHVFSINKLDRKSNIYQRRHIDYIGIKILDSNGKWTSEIHFTGLFSIRGGRQTILNIPIIREKFQRIIRAEKIILHSYNYRQIYNIMDSMPRDILLRESPDKIIKQIKHLQKQVDNRGVQLHFQPLTVKGGIQVIIILESDRFNPLFRRSVQKLLCEAFKTKDMDYHLSMDIEKRAVASFFIYTEKIHLSERKKTILHNRIIELSRSWDEKLRNILKENNLENIFLSLPEDYRVSNTPEDAVTDLEWIHKTAEHGKLELDIRSYEKKKGSAALELVFYSPGTPLNLSYIFPVIASHGLTAMSERTFHVPWAAGIIYIHRFSVGGINICTGISRDIKQIKNSKKRRSYPRPGLINQHRFSEMVVNLRESLLGVLEKKYENDRLNGLVTKLSFSPRQVHVLRALHDYYRMVGTPYTRRTINNVLLKYTSMTKLLWEYFELKFKKKKLSEHGEKKFARLWSGKSNSITLLSEDRIFRSLKNIIDAMTRTNYFLRDDLLFAFKIRSEKIKFLTPHTVFSEIFVYHPGVKGIHLRGGKIARGGIRLSDRPDDLRVEIMDLVTTQTFKNSLIVPTGAKGGFCLKKPCNNDRKIIRQNYIRFINGLLDMMDNEDSAGNHNGIRYDKYDPYLVVAADKGTAWLSDTANEVSNKRGFWLDDAFASGGKYGYDHKKEGITAAGAWVTAKRLLWETGINIFRDSFTVIGIGDMSGDVFGNGMLMSKNIKLIAAFDHRHIFIDPEPDVKKSYDERLRLFRKPNSSWMGYSAKIISGGGGVYPRTSKKIVLSTSALERLGLRKKVLNGEELIQSILSAPADILYNGGIGTYICGSNESNEEVGDPSNDLVRITASDLRVKIIVEGGNLGLTTAARMEFAENGGLGLLDAIDNSAGVDMSDHEVNLKLLLKKPLNDKSITFPERNSILTNILPDVREHVLAHNEWQTIRICMETMSSKDNIDDYIEYIKKLNRCGVLLPGDHSLPTGRTLEERKRKGSGLFMPEISRILSYSKIFLKKIFVDNNLHHGELLHKYFPKKIYELKNIDEIIAVHPLKDDISITALTNHIIDRNGILWFDYVKRELNMDTKDALNVYFIADNLLEFNRVRDEILGLTGKCPADDMYRFLWKLNDTLLEVMRWLDDNFVTKQLTGNKIKKIKSGLQEFERYYHKSIDIKTQKNIDNKIKSLRKNGFSKKTSFFLIQQDYIITYLDAILISDSLVMPIGRVFEYIWSIGTLLNFEELFRHLRVLRHKNNWDKLACRGMISDFRTSRKRLVFELLSRNISFNKYYREHKSTLLEIYDKIDAILNTSPESFAPYIVIIHDIKQCIHRLNI